MTTDAIEDALASFLSDLRVTWEGADLVFRTRDGRVLLIVPAREGDRK